jgi:hypothetical protein
VNLWSNSVGMNTRLRSTIRATLIATAFIWSQSALPQVSPIESGSITILGHVYYFPEFVRTDPGEYIFISYFYGGGAEVSMNAKFWNGLYEDLAELKGWQITTAPTVRYTNIRPVDNVLYFWPAPRAKGMPPVREQVASEKSSGPYKVWKSLDQENSTHPRYITYPGRGDFYVSCGNDELYNANDACDINWNDRGLVHSFFIPGNLIAIAPKIVDRYIAVALGTSLVSSK